MEQALRRVADARIDIGSEEFVLFIPVPIDEFTKVDEMLWKSLFH